jgi:valyl-tRNA synthetase
VQYEDKWHNESHRLEKKWTDKVEQLKKDLYDNPDDKRTSKVVRFQNLYYSQLVCRSGTNLPDVCPYTGAVKTKADKYKEELETALADVERMQKLMPADDMSALLKSVKKKARTLKRKYANAKKQLRDDFYIDSLDDKHCERDKDFSDDSDAELREELKPVEEPRMMYHDPSCPPGFRVRSPSPV